MPLGKTAFLFSGHTTEGVQMSVELLVMIAGSLLSLAVRYVPQLRERYDRLDAEGKARVMAVALVLVTLGVFGLACANLLVLFGLEVACTAASAVQLIQLLFLALMANQSTYMIAVRPAKK